MCEVRLAALGDGRGPMSEVLKRLWWRLICRWFDRHAPGVDSEGWLCTRCGKRLRVEVVSELYFGSEQALIMAAVMGEEEEDEAKRGPDWNEVGPEMPEYLRPCYVATDIQALPDGTRKPINVREGRWLGSRWGGIDTPELGGGEIHFWRYREGV